MPFPKAKGSETVKFPTIPNHSNGFLTLTKEETNALAKYKKECDIRKEDLADTEIALHQCYTLIENTTLWWQTPTGVLGIAVMGILFGAFFNKITNSG